MSTRSKKLETLCGILRAQIENQAIAAEVLTFVDNGEISVGAKRDELLKRALGEYCVFVDDDDDVVYDYIKTINESLSGGLFDCMGMMGVLKQVGKRDELFIHSIKYNVWEKRQNIYVRPPNHLNPMKTSIAREIGFSDLRRGEDMDFSMRLSKSRLIKNEDMIKRILYIYNYNPRK